MTEVPSLRASLMAQTEDSTCSARVLGSVPGLGRFPGERHGNPLQYSCLETPTDRGAWWATAHGVTQSRTRLKQLSMHTLTMQCASCSPCQAPGSPGRLDSPMPTSVPHTGTDLLGSIPLPFSPSSLPGISLDSNACLSDCFWGNQPMTVMDAVSGSWDWIPGEKGQKQSSCSDLTPYYRAPHFPQETVCIPGRGPLWLPHPPWPHQWALEASSSLLGCPLGCESWEGRDWDVGPVWHPEDAQDQLLRE